MKSTIEYYFERIFAYIPTQSLLPKSFLNQRAKEKVITVLVMRHSLSKLDNKKLSKLKKGLDAEKLEFLDRITPKISLFSFQVKQFDTPENMTFEQLAALTKDLPSFYEYILNLNKSVTLEQINNAKFDAFTKIDRLKLTFSHFSNNIRSSQCLNRS